MDFSKVPYLSDSSRNWGNRYKIKDAHSNLRIRHTDDIINLIGHGLAKRLYILIHPDEWSSNYYQWQFDLVTQSIINLGKIGIKLHKKVVAGI